MANIAESDYNGPYVENCLNFCHCNANATISIEVAS